MKLYTRDWLDNKELRRCSPAARAVLIDLMCIASEGEPYGYLSDKVGPLTEQYLAARCFVSPAKFRHAVAELVLHGRVIREERGRLYIDRMVRDEEVRAKRAAGGAASIGHPNTPPPKQLEGYPSAEDVAYPSNRNEGGAHSRARTRADSDSDSVFGFEVFWERFPRKHRRRESVAAFAACVQTDSRSVVMDCLDRYLVSDEVSRGVIQSPDRWIQDQHACGWRGEWPVTQNGRLRVEPRRELAPNPAEEIAAIRWVLSTENPDSLTEEERDKWRDRLAKLEAAAS